MMRVWFLWIDVGFLYICSSFFYMVELVVLGYRVYWYYDEFLFLFIIVIYIYVLIFEEKFKERCKNKWK